MTLPRSLCPAAIAGLVLLTTFSILPLHAEPDGTPLPIISTTIRIRHSKASRIAMQLLSSSSQDRQSSDTNVLPFLPGVESLSADDKAGRLKVSGDKESINRLRELVSLLDQPARIVKLRATLSRAPYTTDDRPVTNTTPLATTEVSVGNRETVQIPLSAAGVGLQCAINPKINSDRTVTLYTSTNTRWRVSEPQISSDNGLGTESTRHVRQDETYRVLLTAAATLPHQVGKRQQYYLELTPVEVKSP